MAISITNGRATDRAGFADLFLLLGRACLAANFVFWGSQKFLNPPNIAHVLESAGLPGVLVYPTFMLQIFGGLMILAGFQVRLAAALLGWFCIIAPSIFWIHAPMNLARDYSAAGGFILLLSLGAGSLSCDARLPRRMDLLGRRVSAIGSKGKNAILLIARLLIALPLLTDAALRVKQLYVSGQSDPAYSVSISTMIMMIAVEAVAGISIALGLRVRIACLAVLPLWAWSAVAFHMPPLQSLADDGLSITKDLTTIGALLLLVAHYWVGPMFASAKND